MNLNQEEYSKAYYSKDTITDEVYPEYLRKETNDAVMRAKSHITDESVCFAFITDIHHTVCHSDDIRLKRTLSVYGALNRELGSLPLIVGGDHTGDGSVKYKTQMFKRLFSKLRSINYFPVNGNHDDGTIWGITHPDRAHERNYLSHKELFSLAFKDLKDRGCETEGEDKLYYFYDDINKKVRYITIDVNDVPYIYDEDGKLKYNGQFLFILSQQQLNWLGNKALKFCEEGWSVILLLHGIRPDNDKSTTYENLIVLKELIGGFKNCEKVDFEFGEGDLKRKINFDFTDYVKADIVGYFAGDAHNNLCFRDKFDIPYIVTANAFPFYYDPPSKERYDGDSSEICINLMTVNKSERRIYVTKVGYGQDFVCEY